MAKRALKEIGKEESLNSISHPWEITIEQAKKIQLELRKHLILKGEPKVRIIAGADCAYSKTGNKIYGVVLVYDLKKNQVIENAKGIEKVPFPYIPGYLSFREGPILLELFSGLKTKPQAVIFDGQGIAHPQRMGIASHLGLWLGIPSIGCAKSRLFGNGKEPAQKFGAYQWLQDDDEVIGGVVRTKKGVKPVFVSPGHLIGIKASIKLVLASVRGYRIPEPLRLAHISANQLRAKEKER